MQGQECTHAGWTTVLNGKKICRKFQFKDFVEAMRFVGKVADIAEQTQHHPDIRVVYNKVTLELTTHDASGLSEKDFQLAAKIDELNK